MADDCQFCRIIRHQISARMVFEDDISAAFLDYRPLFRGHCLLLPKEHYETLPDLPSKLIGPFFRNVQLLTRAVESAMEAEGSFVAMNNRVSQSVLHLHVHIVPRRRKDGLKGFFWPRHKYQSDQEAADTQSAIRGAIKELSSLER